MTPPDTSALAVEAMIAKLRDPYIGKCCDHADEAADMLAAKVAEIERLTRGIKVVQAAARAMDESKSAIIRHLEKPRKEEREAVATLDSERSVNEILTAENEALRTEIATLKVERDAAREALAKAVEAEREACAKIAEGETTKENLWHWPKVSGSLWPKVARGHDFVRQCKAIAAAIRARADEIEKMITESK